MQGIRLLLIDGSEAVRKGIVKYLTNSGCKFFEAGNIRKGMDLLREVKPDIVLIDSIISESNGFSLISTIVEDFPEIPIIVISRTEDLSSAMKAVKWGAWDYMIKPLAGFDVINHSVSKTLEKARLIRENKTYRENLKRAVEKRTGELQEANLTLKREIEERIAAEEIVDKSLKEKEVLLREIHHRVKNNMQLMSSILNLQMEYIDDEKMINIFKGTQNRIRSLALIHEKLYQSGNFAAVNIKEYFTNIANSLLFSYATSERLVHLKSNMESVCLGLDISIPCGLIVNELISNILKYAFYGKREGIIDIMLKMTDGKTVELVITDTGVGLPKNFDMEKEKGLGLKLVGVLLEQINGSMDLFNNNPGVGFRIRFQADLF